jgi:hypothetical protein
MCIVAALPAIIAIASAAASYSAAQQQADQQNAYAQRNAQASIRAFEDSTASTNAKYLSEAETASQKALIEQQQVLKARSTALAAADSSMTGGLSVDAMMQEAAFGMSQERHAMNTDMANRHFEASDQLRAAHHNAKARINSVQTARDPSAVPYILSGLSGALTRVDSKGLTASGGYYG